MRRLGGGDECGQHRGSHQREQEDDTAAWSASECGQVRCPYSLSFSVHRYICMPGAI